MVRLLASALPLLRKQKARCEGFLTACGINPCCYHIFLPLLLFFFFCTAWHCLSFCSYTFHFNYCVADVKLWLLCDLSMGMDKDAVRPAKGSRREGWCLPSLMSPQLQMVSPVHRNRKPPLPSVLLHSRVLPMLSSAVAERVQRQELVKREVISECFIERQTRTIRSKFSVSLDGDLTNVFLLTRGWEWPMKFVHLLISRSLLAW